MRKHHVLITCMGGYGAEYLAENIRRSSVGDQIRFFGTHADPYFLACSTAEVKYLVPWTKQEEQYIGQTLAIIKKEKIDLFIPKSDREVSIASQHRDRLGCRYFLPDHAETVASQDKFSFYQILKESSVGAAETFRIHSLEEIPSCISLMPGRDRYWVRVKTPGEAGAVTATWVKTAEQARMWIQLWHQLHGVEFSEFTISEFLPGRLFECLLLFYQGKLKLAKAYENIRYHAAEQKVSGMASTPGVARGCSNPVAITALKEAVKAVEAVGRHVHTKPHGIYHLSVKLDQRDHPCVTESNVGRFPSTCAFFERIGKHSVAELFIKYALGIPVEDLRDPFDLGDPSTYMIWALGRALTIKSQKEIEACQPIEMSLQEGTLCSSTAKR